MTRLERRGLYVAFAIALLATAGCGSENNNGQEDENLCGDTACAEGQVCDEATQTCKPKPVDPPGPTCSNGLNDCSGVCKDLTSDVNNCGRCGNVCGENQNCFNSECVDETSETCSEGLEACDDACVDLKSDHDHCGGCDIKCGDNQTCHNGSCDDEVVIVPECDASFEPVCEENAVKTCENGQFVLEECGEKVCENAACHEPVVDEDECDVQEFEAVCEGNAVKKCEAGKFVVEGCTGDMVCQDGVCSVHSDPGIQDGDACDPDKDAVDVCSGNAVLSCVIDENNPEAHVFKLAACGENEMCQEGVCYETCSEETYVSSCDAHNNLLSCRNGLVTAQTCGALKCTESVDEETQARDVSCQEEVIIEQPECQDDEAPVCEGSGIKSCVDGKYVIEACGENKVCVENQCIVPKIEDLCPDDETKKGPGVCGCGVPDQDLDDNGVIDCLEYSDFCPDDPAKTLPGICGCNIPDTLDENGNPLCLTVKVDYCPEDKAKSVPGVCGCGYPDTIDPLTRLPLCVGTSKSDEPNDLCTGNEKKYLAGVCGCGVLDTISEEGGVVPDCIQTPAVCGEDDPFKAGKPGGICGCGVEDSEANLADDDKDGVPNCLDMCPDNPYKYLSDRCQCAQLRMTLDGKDICALPIASAQEFLGYRAQLADGSLANSASTAFVLMNDIDLRDVFESGEVTDWTGIKGFKGKLLSIGKTIRFTSDDGLGSLECTSAYCGLFYSLASGSRIHDINFEMNVIGDAGRVGILAGNADGSTITSVSVKGDVAGKDLYVGGVVGYGSGSTLSDVKYNGKVLSTSEQVGGIIGRSYGSSLSAIEMKGSVSSDAGYVGGVAGYMSNASTVTGANVDADVSSQLARVGGIAGYATAGNSITSANMKGSVSGSERIGGIAGEIGSGSLSKSSSNAAVKGTLDYVGGIVGVSNVTLSDVEAGGSVHGRRYVGGIAGQQSKADITNAVNTSEVTAHNNVSAWWARIGGIVGNFGGGYTIKGSKNSGSVTVTCEGFTYKDSNGKTVESSGNCIGVGGIAGFITDTTAGTLIEDCENTGAIKEPSSYLGGIIGRAYTTSLKNVKNSGSVSGTSYCGGIGGYMDMRRDAATANMELVAENVENSGKVACGSYTGGIFGLMNVYHEDAQMRFTKLVNSGAVSGATYTGGIIGFSRANGKLMDYSHLYSTGDVTSTGDSVGGLFGSLYTNNDSEMLGTKARSNNIRIDRSFSGGTVKGAANVGGIAGLVHTYGYNRSLNEHLVVRCDKDASVYRDQYKWKYYDMTTDISVSNSFAYGLVQGTSSVGGLFGYVEGSSTKPSYTDTLYTITYATADNPCDVHSSTQASDGGAVSRMGKLTVANSYSAAQVYGTAGTVAGLFGRISNTNSLGAAYNYLINNVYTTGDVSSTGAFVLGNKPSNVDYKNIYYWSDAGAELMTPAGNIDSFVSFSYKKAVPYLDNDKKLLDVLNENIAASQDAELGSEVSANWVEASRKLANNLKVTVPSIENVPEAVE